MAEDVYVFPASFAQQRLWFLDQLMPGNPFYNISAAIPLRFNVSPPVFERCLDDIVRRHDALRTTVAAMDGEPCQVVAPHRGFHLEVADLRALPKDEQDAEIKRLATHEATRPFDLAHGPLFRARLLQLASEDFVFLVAMHHIISDGWSLGIFFRELDALYTAFATGRSPALPEPPIQYGDYAVWQRNWLKGEVFDGLLAYWRRQLAGLEVLDLHTDRPRPVAQSFQGVAERVSIPADVAAGVRALSRHEGVTPFMTLLAAFKVLLRHYTGQDDVVVGLPVAGRNRAELEGLIGFFINSLVLRTDLSGNPTFQELLARVRRVALGAYEHQDLPFEKLVEELQIERDLSRNPLFQVTFQLINPPTLKAAEGASRGYQNLRSLPEIQRGTAMFDLAFDLLEVPDGFEGYLEYSTDLFDASTIRRMGRHFVTLLRMAVSAPETPLSSLRCGTDEEMSRLLNSVNRTGLSGPEELLHRLVEAQVERTPDEVAVVDGTARLTFGQLNARANQLAWYLIERGIGTDCLVGICVERSLDMVVAMLGVLKAGAAYVPIDVSQPALRLAAMLNGAAAVIVSGAAPLLEAGERLIVDMQTARPELARRGPANPSQPCWAENLAYAIFTSGSTGSPKGVAIPHRAICNHMRWMLSRFPLDGSDRVLQRTPVSFDASVWEVWAPLMAGARLVLASPVSQADTTELVHLMAAEEITVVQMVPSLLRLLVEEPSLKRCVRLKRLFSGGESLTLDVKERTLARLPVELHNLYGPTEAAIDTTCFTCTRSRGPVAVPIGHAIDNVSVYVLDRYMNLVAEGVPGELYIGGAGLARGYVGHPDLTAERFVPDPFGDGTRLYRTGDLVRMQEDGALQFLKRVDHQVKLRGYRIEMGEIESALGSHPSVRESTVCIREDVSGDGRLVAYFVPEGGQPRSDEDLRQYLRLRLPEYMVPAFFIAIDALPRTYSGKIDRGALLKLDLIDRAGSSVYVAPRNDVEELLAGMWAELLHVERVGTTQNFFNELGGHSLLATQLTSRVRELFGVHVPLQRIFEAPTIGEFAARLGDDDEGRERVATIATLFLKVESLPDDEVERLLSSAGASGFDGV